MAKAKPKRRMALARLRRPELVAAPVAPGVLGVFQRMAQDPNLTVDTLGELIRLHERTEKLAADKAFDAAYRAMLPEIPRIRKTGVIKNKEGKEQSRYARYEVLRTVLDPIFRRHGFTFHTATEWPSDGVLEVVGVLEHNGGGKRESRFRTTADASGGKNAIQGLGSGVSYGKRYTLIDLASIVWEGQDDDGVAHGNAQASRHRDEPPARVIDVPPAAHNPERGEALTDQQLRRLVVVLKNSGRGDLEVKTWLEHRFGWSSLKQITRERYDEVCRALEAPGSLA